MSFFESCRLIYDAQSIPSLVDGLKVGQRKVMFACFKRNLVREMKVAQLAGFEHCFLFGLPLPFIFLINVQLATSLSTPATITARCRSTRRLSTWRRTSWAATMCRCWCPRGSLAHDTRAVTMAVTGDWSGLVWVLSLGVYQGCVSVLKLWLSIHISLFPTFLVLPASARYIFTQLDPVTRLLFPPSDDALLTYRDDDGFTVEPHVFMPILPVVLLNGLAAFFLL